MRLLIAGAGGHGRVVADAAVSSGSFSEVAFVDDCPAAATTRSWRVVGTLADLGGLRETFDFFVAAFGRAELRLRSLDMAAGFGYELATVIHPSAVVSRFTEIGPGTVVIGGAVINAGCRLDRGSIVNTGATVDHDCVLGKGVHICPGAHLAGDVQVGSRTWFGIGAVAKQGVSIGADVIVGAGAVVIRDVPDGLTIVGNPARPLRKK